MPYIKSEQRTKYMDGLTRLPTMATKGELEYCVFYLMRLYMTDKRMRYSTLHDCTYAVQHASDEFRRRFLDAREDDARRENGEITL